jgi:hypothetical protein
MDRPTAVAVFGGVPANVDAVAPGFVRHQIHGSNLPPRSLFETGYDHVMGLLSVQKPLVVRVSYWQLVVRSAIRLCGECARTPDRALGSLEAELGKRLRKNGLSHGTSHWWLQTALPYDQLLKRPRPLRLERRYMGLPDRPDPPDESDEPHSCVRIADLVRDELAPTGATSTLLLECAGSRWPFNAPATPLTVDGVVEAVAQLRRPFSLRLPVAPGRHELGVGLEVGPDLPSIFGPAGIPKLSLEVGPGTTSRIQLSMKRWGTRPQAVLLEEPKLAS